MDVKERFKTYIVYDTQADAESKEIPSSPGQRVFAEALYREIKSLGIEDVQMDEKGYIYGKIPANTDKAKSAPVLGFIAHMDTATNFPGPGDSARMIENYQGGDIELCDQVYLSPEEYPALRSMIGDDLVVTNGKTLLGGDDKAGVAEIVTALEYMTEHPEFEHGQVAFAFTPDEEIGGSTKHFDLKKFGADMAYTLDGEAFGTLEYESFCNGAVQLSFHGVSAHPGYAKGVMKNALNIANEFHNLLPAWDRAEHSEGYEGFFHLVIMEGNPQESKSAYLIKDFEEEGYRRRKAQLEAAVSYINGFYGEGTVTAEYLDGKMNMASLIIKHPQLINIALEEIEACGVSAQTTPMRGGTDGVSLTFSGLPCPNLGTGSFNHHSVHEFASVDQMKKSVELILRLIGRFSRR